MNSQTPDVRRLTEAWGISIDPDLLVLALTHRSFANEEGGLPTNERLEFLGDSVLSIVVTEKLYRDYPGHPEGHLAKMRAATVSQPALAAVARKIDLGPYILLGKGEDSSGGRNKDSILSDTVEALIGATYLTHKLEKTRKVVEDLLADLLDQVVQRGIGMDWKTTFQELAAALELSSPVYESTSTGPDHARVFTAQALVDGQVVASGTASSKKLAQHEAARAAVEELQKRYDIHTPLGFDVDVEAVRKEVNARTARG